jgi:hypothetical protein
MDPIRMLAALALGTALSAGAAPGPVALRTIVSGINAPVDIARADDGSNRLYVVEQAGVVRLLRPDGRLGAVPFLDITPQVANGGEQGLLGLAFDPSYATNGRFYVYYNRAVAPPDGGSEIVVARYTRSLLNPEVADPASGAVLLVVPHPQFSNHNGGRLAFGPDGYLYIGIGDGGGGGDPFHTAQDLQQLRGKILRIDVRGNPAPGLAYAIPATNPFVGAAGARAEIFAYGLRNPWRFSFDRATGDLFIGDVGQDAWEEIDLLPRGTAGQDLGWSVFEGTHCYNPPTACALANHVRPIIEYGHDANGGNSVTGGFRYRGHGVAELRGAYVYGDFVSGRVWAALPGAPGAMWTSTPIASIGYLTTFGEDDDGELYAASAVDGSIVRFMPVDTDGDGMSDAFEARYFGGTTAGDAAADSDGDGIPNGVEYREGTDPLVKDNDVYGNARLLAMQQYRDFLGREGDERGIVFWTAFVSGPPAKAATLLVAQFLGAPEAAATAGPATRLYFAAFGRVPDYAGLAFWMAQLRAGLAPVEMARFFAASAEFQAGHGALDNAAFVATLYRDVLGRQGDASGVAFWTSQLDSGARDRGEVLLAFSESPEYRAATAPEATVVLAYAALLRRAPDAGGFAFWSDRIAAGGRADDLIAAVLSSSEYRQRFLP